MIKKTKIFASLCIAIILILAIIPTISAKTADNEAKIYSLVVNETPEDISLKESAFNSEISLFSRRTFSTCYGDQLTGIAKEVYDSLVEKYATEGKTEKYSYKFQNPITFKAEISGSSIVSNEALETAKTNLRNNVFTSVYAFLYDHPEVFWIYSLSYTYSITATSGQGEKNNGIISSITIKPVEIYDGATSKISAYKASVDKVVSSIDTSSDPYNRYAILKQVHDLVCQKAYYNSSNEYKVHTSEPFFTGDGGVVCEGYSEAFKVICDRLGIPCVLVPGKANTGNGVGLHMWNYVKMQDDKWYLVDTTWDDQDSKLYETYFIANSGTQGFYYKISDERSEMPDFLGNGYFIFSLPSLSSSAYVKHNHKWGNLVTDIEATCTTYGTKSRHCVYGNGICKAQKDIQIIRAKGHISDNGTVTAVATCTEAGTMVYNCKNCETFIRAEVIRAKGHTEVIDPEVKPTCLANGKTEGSHCSVCNAVIKKQETVKATGHISNNGTVTKAATCTETGTKVYNCKNCGTAIRAESISAKGHTEVIDPEVKPTCLANGKTEGSHCSVCNIVIKAQLTIITKGHVSDAGTVKKDSTCIEEGLIEYCCINCNAYISSKSTPLSDHTEVIDQKIEPTCLTDGKTEGSHCSVCNKVIKEQETVKALGHEYSSKWTTDKKATCTKSGSKSHHCIRCDEKSDITTIKATGHSYSTKTTKATTSANGKIVKSCKFCERKTTTTIYKISTVTLSTKTYTYNGKTKKPSVTVKDSKGKKLEKDEDYTVEYSSDRKNVGQYTVTVKFKGQYSGTKKLTFKILPKGTSVTDLKAGKKQFTVKWNKQTNQTSGYQIQYSTNSNMKNGKTKSVSGNSNTSAKITGLKSGKTYYVRIRTYKTVKINGESVKLYSSWSSVKKVKI